MVQEADRLAWANAYISAAEAIASTTKQLDVKASWDYFRDHACVCLVRSQVPETIDVKPLQGQPRPNKKSLFVIPLSKEDIPDSCATPELRACLEKGSAFYMPSGNAILLPMDHPETDFMLGCRLIHEAGHAHNAYIEQQTGLLESQPPLESRLKEEVLMHTRDHQLWLERGGQTYRDLIHKGESYIAEKTRAASTRKLAIIDPNLPWVRTLDAILGPPPNETTHRARVFLLSIHTNFVAVDNNDSFNDKLREKANVMGTFYHYFAPQMVH